MRFPHKTNFNIDIVEFRISLFKYLLLSPLVTFHRLYRECRKRRLLEFGKLHLKILNWIKYINAFRLIESSILVEYDLRSTRLLEAKSEFIMNRFKIYINMFFFHWRRPGFIFTFHSKLLWSHRFRVKYFSSFSISKCNLGVWESLCKVLFSLGFISDFCNMFLFPF